METNVWRKAIQQSHSLLSPLEQLQFKNSSPEDIIHDFQTHHFNRGKIRKLLHKIQPFITAVERYGKSLDVLVNVSPTILSPTWGILRALLLLAREHEEYFTKLINMLQNISDALPRFQTYEALFRDHASLQQTLCSMYLELISFLCKAKKVFGCIGRLKRMVLWRSFDEAFCTHIGQLLRYGELVEREAGMADMIEGSNARMEVKALMRVLIEDRRLREEGSATLKSWLNARQCHEEKDGIGILDGTCEWLLDRKELAAWIVQDGLQLFWLYGPPGCGKSFLYAKTLQYIDESLCTPFVYFLFCGADGERVTVAALLRSWIFQLAKLFDEARDFVVRSRKNSENRKSSDKEVYELFYSLLDIIPPCILTVDAVDECLDKSAFYRLLTQIPKHFKIMITSRHLSELRTHLNRTQKFKYTELEVLPEMTVFDIELFITAGLRQAKTKYCPEIISRIKEKLKDSNGIFLWIRLMFQYIEDQTCNEEIIKCLNELPLSLTARYDRILQDINALAKTKPQERLLAHKIFFWVSVARRPLAIKEVCGLLAVKPASDRDNGFVEWRIPNDPDATIMSICGSLLVARRSNRVLYPIHFTASEYLKQYMKSDERLAEITTYYEVQQLRSSDSLAAAVCMRYLSLTFIEDLHERVISGYSDPLKVLNSDGLRLGMLRYATMQWFNHLKTVQSPEPLLLNIADEFLDESRRNLEVFWNLYWSSNPASDEQVVLPVTKATRRHVVAHFALQRVLKRPILSPNPVIFLLGIILSLISVLIVSLNMQSLVQVAW